MTISVLQWNIWCNEDIKSIVKFLRSNKADIICLQELTDDKPAYVAEQLGYDYYFKELPIESTDGKPLIFANGIFSRFPITNRKFVWTNEPKNKGGYDDEYRAYVEVELDIDGKKLHVGTTHMSYTHRFEVTPNKQKETDMLVEQLSAHNDSFIFTGDLNAGADSYTIKAVAGVLQHAGPAMEQKTWTTKPFSYNGFEVNDLDWRLDYVFATKDIKVVSSKILTTDYSDHLPILAEVTLK